MNDRVSRHRAQHPETYSSWAQMRSRCNDPHANNYAAYGGRGIQVCERWESFENFLADMGERPKGHSIDRFPDVNGNYEPDNCRWASRADQSRNTTRNIVVTIDGESMVLTDWIVRFGLKKSTVGVRMHRGWTALQALGREPRV